MTLAEPEGQKNGPMMRRMDMMKKRYGVLGALVTLAFLCGVFAPSTRAQFDSLPSVVRGAPHWTLTNDPAVNTAATVSKAAGTGGAVHVADCATATLVANTTAPAAIVVTAVIRDGATGAGTILWSADMALTATAGVTATPVQLCGLNINGTANTAMTIEFTAAGGANTFETVGLTGYDRAQ
jgi:hypothetical protein